MNKCFSFKDKLGIRDYDDLKYMPTDCHIEEKLTLSHSNSPSNVF